MVFGTSYYFRGLLGGHAGDFSWPLNAARSLLLGNNPYKLTNLGPETFPPDVLLYPMPAILLIFPLAYLSDDLAVSIFLAISSFLLAYAIHIRMPHCTPILASASFWACVLDAQWSILLTFFLLFSLLSPLSVVKPPLAMAAVAVQPSIRKAILVLIGMIIICVVTIPILQSWPFDWLENIVRPRYRRLVVIWTIPGFLLCIALIRWKDPAARLLLALACFPQYPDFYDHVALGLIPNTRKRGLIFAGISWILFIFSRLTGQRMWSVVALYLVALVFLMMKPAIQQTNLAK
ncbi:MAG: hypothetical protein RMJ54_12590 [Roseiflexaceae bacterium]|nr:hypothetical protein [Roseiflexus sp.]MDW8233609.1 hypothetical protein [Roseiflexaceae bacterium]